MRSTEDNFVCVKDARSYLGPDYKYQEQSDERRLQEQENEVARVISEQLKLPLEEQDKLLKGIATLGPFQLLYLWPAVDASRFPGATFQWFQDVLLILLGDLEASFSFFGNVAVLFGWLQAAVNFGEVGFAEIGLGLFRRSKVGQVTTLTEEADVVTRIDVVGGVCHQDNGMSLVGQFAQEVHHLTIQARIEARGGLIQEEDTGIGKQFQGNRDTLALPTGEFFDQQLATWGQLNIFKHLVDALLDLLIREVTG